MIWMMMAAGIGSLDVQAQPVRCGTPRMFHEIASSVPTPYPPPPPGTTKAVREAHGTCAGSEKSENFVLKWGSTNRPTASEVEQIMEALERSWMIELGDMEHAHPWGTDSHLFNVYVGDSGDCAPSAYGMGGYYTVDPEGWPMIVLSGGAFDNPEYGRTTVAHEFYHAVQHAEEAYLEREDSQWWWEATAMWVESIVYPTTTDYFIFLYGYAFEPHRQLNSYKYPEEGVLAEYHQYGAAIWPRYLTEFEVDWRVIRDTWVLGGQSDDPIEVTRELLDVDIDAVFADFAAHNAVWDYEHGDQMEQLLDMMSNGSSFGDQDRRITDFVSTSGTGDEWQVPPIELMPERFGYNVIEMSDPREGTMVVRFEGDAVGSEGSVPKWGIRVVRKKGRSNTYEELIVLDGAGQLTLREVGNEDAIYLVVSVTSPGWLNGESFGYRYQMDMGKTTSGDSGGGAPSTPAAWDSGFGESGGFKGCGCSASTHPKRVVWALLPPLLFVARRRN